MKTADVKEIFEKLRPQQVALLQEIAEKEPPDNAFIKQHIKKNIKKSLGAM
jgi:Zn-dependent M32 family carboxypeptidase